MSLRMPLCLPIGVRTASTMTASFMTSPDFHHRIPV
jgi:hypothetical protein